MADYENLKRLAEAATPGPWAYEAHGDTGEYGVGFLLDENDQPVEGRQESGEMLVAEPVAPEVSGTTNAAFIAAANPAAILALIAESEAMQERLQIVDIVHGRKAEQRWAALSAECDRRLAALERVRDQLKAAGATLPAPEPKGRIESAMVQGLCIALALVEEELSVPKQDTGNARLRRKLQERMESAGGAGAAENCRCNEKLQAEQRRAAVLEQNCAELAAELERVRAVVDE